MSETVHACPPGDEALTPCCGRVVFELPRTDRMTVDPALVTCNVRRLFPDTLTESPPGWLTPDFTVVPPDVYAEIGPRHELDMALLGLERLLDEEIRAMCRWDEITEAWDRHAAVERGRHERWTDTMRVMA